jgi:hypothetical protein
MVAVVPAHFSQEYGDDTALTADTALNADTAALNGLSSLSDGQSTHFPQDSGM